MTGSHHPERSEVEFPQVHFIDTMHVVFQRQVPVVFQYVQKAVDVLQL